jgi:O-antigen/teichoic acid export membrane protein
MSTVAALVRNTTVLVAGTVSAKAAVFASYLILTRQLGAEDFGRYAFLFAFASFFELVADAGLDPLVIREATRPGTDAGRRLGDALLLRLLLTILATLAAVTLFPLIKGGREDAPLVLLACATFVTSNRHASLRSLWEVPYRAALRMELPTLLSVLTEILHLGLLAAAILRWGLAGAVAAQAVAQFPGLVVLAWLSARRVRPVFRPDPRRLAELLRTAFPMLGILALNIVLARIDVLMLERMRGSAAVGLYAAAVRLVEVANLLPALLMTSVYPLLTESHPLQPERITRLFQGSLRFLTLCLVPVVIVEVLYPAPILRLLFGDGYVSSAAILPILAASELLVYVDIVLSSRFIAVRLEKRNLQLLLAAALTNVIANWFLIPAFGGAGAALATLLAFAVRVLATFVIAETRPVAREAFAAIAPALGAGAIVAAALFLCRGLPLMFSFAAIPLYAGALLLLRGLKREDLELIRQLRSAAPVLHEPGD